MSLFPSPHTPNMPNNPYAQVRVPYQNMMAGSMVMVPNMGSPNAFIQMQMQMQLQQHQQQQQQHQQQQHQQTISSNSAEVPKATFKKKNLMINIPEGRNQCVPLRVQTPQETSRTDRSATILTGDTTPALPSPLGFGDVNLQLPLTGDINSYLPATSHFWPYPSPRSANAPPQPFPKTEEVITPTSASMMTPNLDTGTFLKTEDNKKRKAEEISLHQ